MFKNGFNKRRAEGVDKSVKPNNLKLKTRKLDHVNTTSYVQILGTGMDTQDSCPSVLLFFDKQRFIFNAGEGLQRYCTEHKIKLSKIDYIFLSRVCSETTGGLPGLLLTLDGIGDQGMRVNIRGPSGFKYLVDAMSTFIPRCAMVNAESFGPKPQLNGIDVPDPRKFSEPHDLIDDEVVKLSAILLHPNENNGLGTVVQPTDISVIYVCELPKIQGKFYPEKAKALGLRPGPKYRELQNGESVKSDNLDIMVHPRDVMDPPIPGPIVLLVDCPTTSHLQSLLSVETLNAYYTDYSDHMSVNAKAVNCVIHLSPSSVSNSPDYQKWMKRFGNAQHIMAGHEKKNAEIPVLKSSAMLAARLNYLCPQFFPASGFLSPHVDNISLHSNSGSPAVVSAENLLKFNLRPHGILGFDRSSIPDATGPAEIVAKLQADIPEIVDSVQQVKQFWDHPEEVINADSSQSMLPSCLENITKEDMEIVLLGTGSSQPSKYRNVSSIFINLFSKGGLLLDCGEGTLGQLKRRFGAEVADEVVRSLRCIWISHIHADHHTGLVRILALRRDLLKDIAHEPLLVVGPVQLKPFLAAYVKLEELDMQFLNCECTTRVWDPSEKLISNPGDVEILNRFKKVLLEAGLETLISFPVIHCHQAFGVSVKALKRTNKVGEMVPGWKIVYSGDTRPCKQLIEESQNATVLIHEATFEDDMIDEAVARKHCTTKEAIEVGETANVYSYRLIMTHFSQRYPKIPVFSESHMHDVCIGFDMMSINLADLPVLPRVLPHLKLLFRDELRDEVVEELPFEESCAHIHMNNS
ncbi:hypothetical protein RND81_10G021400 [Saponaria officinalis]|uniref:ribonuclease Z n=1 Tax=Saponaria officinalis TaxID=3572 RepID=A0AAW1HZE5_SAPOF